MRVPRRWRELIVACGALLSVLDLLTGCAGTTILPAAPGFL